jgi:hypothetical protein
MPQCACEYGTCVLRTDRSRFFHAAADPRGRAAVALELQAGAVQRHAVGAYPPPYQLLCYAPAATATTASLPEPATASHTFTDFGADFSRSKTKN